MEKNARWNWMSISIIVYIILLIIAFFYNEIVGILVFFFPWVIYWLYGMFKSTYEILTDNRRGENFFLYYLVKVPYYIFLAILYVSILIIWYCLPAYYINDSLFHRILIDLLGGEIGKMIWILLYVVIMSYIGSKILTKLNII
jgi:hypothetical protein